MMSAVGLAAARLAARVGCVAVAPLKPRRYDDVLRDRNAPFRRPLPIILALVGALHAIAATPRADLETGNALYAQGKYDEALAHFEAAAQQEDPRTKPTALHNRAAALYQLGRHADAREAWVQALPLGDAPFEADARYNIGNTHYQEALAVAQSGGTDAKAVLGPLEQAVKQYRDAIALTPTFTDARANLELALQLKKQIEEQSQPSSQPSENNQQNQQSDQNQNQNQSGQNQQQSNQNQNSAGQQNQSQDQQQSNQNSTGQSDQQQPGEENANRNGEAEQETGAANNNSAQGNENKNGAADSEQDEQQENADSTESKSNEASEPDTAEDQPKPPPAEQSSPEDNHALNGNNNAGAQQQEGQVGQSVEEEAGTEAKRAVHLTQSEAERLLQMIRDAEKARREALRRALRSRQPHVERDW